MIRREELLTRFVAVKPTVSSLEEAAEAMGVSYAALEKGLERARAAGDERGVYTPLHTVRIKPRPEGKEARILRLWSALPSPKPLYIDVAEELGTTSTGLALIISRARRKGLDIEPSGYFQRGISPRAPRAPRPPRQLRTPATRRTPGPKPRPAVDVEAILEEWEFLRDSGEHWERAYSRLGISRTMFSDILLAARKQGDHRGQLTTAAAIQTRRIPA